MNDKEGSTVLLASDAGRDPDGKFKRPTAPELHHFKRFGRPPQPLGVYETAPHSVHPKQHSESYEHLRNSAVGTSIKMQVTTSRKNPSRVRPLLGLNNRLIQLSDSEKRRLETIASSRAWTGELHIYCTLITEPHTRGSLVRHTLGNGLVTQVRIVPPA